MKKKIIKFAEKLIRGNWYVLQHQFDKVVDEVKKYNKGKKGNDRTSQSEIIRWAIDNMPPYEKN